MPHSCTFGPRPPGRKLPQKKQRIRLRQARAPSRIRRSTNEAYSRRTDARTRQRLKESRPRGLPPGELIARRIINCYTVGRRERRNSITRGGGGGRSGSDG